MQNRSDGPFLIFRQTVQQIFAIAEADFWKIIHDPTELVTRMIQPMVWLLIFGQALANAKAIPTGNLPYIDYMAPGILAQSVLFVAIFYGIALIWERDMGILQKILVTPAPRFCLVIGRGIAAGIRALTQVVVVYVICYFLGVNLRWDIPSLFGVLAMVLMGGAVFSTFSLIIASIVKKRERFMGIGQVITMPLFFASNALYPIDIMPGWIRAISILNPLTYQVDTLRSLMIMGETSHFGIFFDFGINFVVFIVLVIIATHFYPKILY
jgi:ABC-2 type transport system permease protein